MYKPGLIVLRVRSNLSASLVPLCFSVRSLPHLSSTPVPTALTFCLLGSSLFGSFTTAFQISQINAAFAADCPVIDEESGWADSGRAMSCKLQGSILAWLLIFSVFALYGIVCVGLGSLGNYVGHTRFYLPILGAVSCVLMSYAATTTGPDEYGEATRSFFRYMMILCRLLAGLAAYFHMCNLAAIVFRDKELHEYKWGRWSGLAPLGREAHVKSAGAHKMNLLVGNAMGLMKTPGVSTLFKTYFGHGLSAFTVSGVTLQEEAGGFTWLWQKIRDQSLER